MGASTLFEPSDQVNSVKKLVDLDIRTVELIPFYRLPSKGNAKKLKDLAKDYDLRYSVHALSMPYVHISHRHPRIREAYRDEVMNSVVFASEIGSPILTVHPGSMPEEPALSEIKAFTKLKLPRDRYLKWSIQSLREILECCEKRNVKLSIENLSPAQQNLGASPQEIRYILSELDSPYAGVTLDVGHANITKNFQEFIQILGKYITHVHVHDNDGAEDEHLGLGKGTIDFSDVMQKFRDIHYQGNLILELYSYEDIQDSKQLIEKMMKNY